MGNKYHYILITLVLVKICSSLLQPSVDYLQNTYFENQFPECVCKSGTEEDLKNAITKTYNDIEKIRIEEMIPGLVAGISIKGKDVWTEAFGETDIENEVKTHKDSVWRLASISKSLTTALIAKLIDRGLIDLDKSIHQYLSEKVFPIKQWKSKNVTITVKQVMSHMAGLRITKIPDDFERIYDFKNVTQTISQFKNEPLIHEPGNGFNYSNYGFQIIGAIIESVMNESYESAINKMFKELGMSSTYAERHDMIIPHRAHYYMKNTSPDLKNNKNVTKVELLNAMIIDDLVSLEAQWPCGGIVSTVPDLLKFGNYMLNSYKGVVDVKAGNV
jgi:serine beta-lactamase-like protein LACTB